MIADPRFTVERIVAVAEPAVLQTGGRPLILMSLEHPLEVERGGATAALHKYQTVLIPAAAGRCSVRAAETKSPFLFVTPPQSAGRLAARLRAAGLPQSRIDAFSARFSIRASTGRAVRSNTR